MKKKKASLWIFLTIFVLLLLFPIFLLAAGSLMGVEELRESYGSVLYGTGGKLHWKLFPLYPTLKMCIRDRKLSHACVLRRCWDLIGDGRIHQFGIRSGEQEEFYWAKKPVSYTHLDVYKRQV